MAALVKTPAGRWEIVVRRTGWPTKTKTLRTKRDAENRARRAEGEMQRSHFQDSTPVARSLSAVPSIATWPRAHRQKIKYARKRPDQGRLCRDGAIVISGLGHTAFGADTVTRHFFATHFGTYQVEHSAAGARLSGWDEDPEPTLFGQHYLDLAAHECRVDQPMVRRGWLTGDRQSRRGADTFVPVDWSRATALVAGEIGRIVGQHGNRAIYAGSYGWASAGRFHHAQSQLKRMLNVLGGFTASVNSYSYGTAGALLPHVIGPEYAGSHACPASWDQIARHTDTLVMFGVRLSNTQCSP